MLLKIIDIYILSISLCKKLNSNYIRAFQNLGFWGFGVLGL